MRDRQQRLAYLLYIFFLQKEGKETEIIKHPIKSEQRENALRIYGKDSRILFTVGNECIVLKENVKHQSMIFNNEFTPKRITVYQMNETREQYRKQEKEMKQKIMNNHKIKFTCDSIQIFH